jgi:hypothetical protein
MHEVQVEVGVCSAASTQTLSECDVICGVVAVRQRREIGFPFVILELRPHVSSLQAGVWWLEQRDSFGKDKTPVPEAFNRTFRGQHRCKQVVSSQQPVALVAYHGDCEPALNGRQRSLPFGMCDSEDPTSNIPEESSPRRSMAPCKQSVE